MNDKYNADIALLTDHRYEAMVALPGDWYLGNILEDDGLLQKALEKQLSLENLQRAKMQNLNQ